MKGVGWTGPFLSSLCLYTTSAAMRRDYPYWISLSGYDIEGFEELWDTDSYFLDMDSTALRPQFQLNGSKLFLAEPWEPLMMHDEKYWPDRTQYHRYYNKDVQFDRDELYQLCKSSLPGPQQRLFATALPQKVREENQTKLLRLNPFLWYGSERKLEKLVFECELDEYCCGLGCCDVWDRLWRDLQILIATFMLVVSLIVFVLIIVRKQKLRRQRTITGEREGKEELQTLTTK